MGYNSGDNTIIKIENQTGYAYCKRLGMTPNDNTKASSNYALLLAAIKAGLNVMVDDAYYLQSGYDTTSAENEISGDIVIVGNIGGKSKFILNGGTFFNAKGNIHIENVDIECPTATLTYLFNLNAPFAPSIVIKNNYVTGNIRLLNTIIPLNYDYETNSCIIEKLVIENNEFNDVYNSTGSRQIFNLQDTPVIKAYILKNKVTNFSYVFINNAITNGNTSTEYLIKNTNYVIKDNIVICTDDYDATVRSGSGGGYYCFSVIEGYTVECKRNWFEGWHVINIPTAVLYDNYFSVTELIYENNTWRNIVNFTADIQYVDIMKSKMGTAFPEKKLRRVYRGNDYIVEASYADKFSQDKFLLRKEINTYQDWMDEVVIENNYFDMYILSFNCFVEAKNYVFNNNTVKMETVEHSINTQAFIFIGEAKDDLGNFVDRNLVFTNNKIICKNPPSVAATKDTALIMNYAGVGDKTIVTFKNNYIEWHDLKYVLQEKRSSATVTSDGFGSAIIVFKDNVVKSTSNAFDLYFNTPQFQEIINSKNNKFIVSLIGKQFKVFYVPTGNNILPLCLKTDIDIQYQINGTVLQLINLQNIYDEDYTIKCHIERLGLSGDMEEFDITFTLTNDGTYNIVGCMGKDLRLGETEFTQKNYVVDGTGNSNNNFEIMQENYLGSSVNSSLLVNISNSSSAFVRYISIVKNANYNDNMKITMTITKLV